jgi:NAD(P)-dependent dehydrogenase (short-subunit alcohol dehydrogenase family)
VGGPLQGQVAIVTGAGQSLGRAFAQRLCEAGAHVAIAEINPDSGRQAAAELADAGHLATFYEVDVTDVDQFKRMVDDLVARFGRVDILVNNAGILALGPSEDVGDEWDDVLGVNLTALFRCSQIVARVMIPAGRGSIVNIGSLAALGGWAKRLVYGTSKGSVVALTRILGIEWRKYGIRVNTVSPGQIDTPFNDAPFKAGLASREVFTNRAPMRRFGTTEEVADAVVFFASDESSGITAANLVVDGGWSAWSGLGITDPLGV